MDFNHSSPSSATGIGEEEEELLEIMEFPRWAIANSHYLEFHNRMAPDIDFSCISLLLASIFIYLMFLLIVITARRRKIPTFFIGTVIIFTGSVLAFSYVDPFWYTGSVIINSTYNLRQPDNFAVGEVKMKFGLRTFNVSYVSLDHINDDLSFSYNELFRFDSSHPKRNLQDVFKRSLQNGLPNPIICILDHLSFSPNREGLIGIILLILTPKYGIYFIALDGFSLLGVVLLYFLKVPRDPLIIIEVIFICVCSKKILVRQSAEAKENNEIDRQYHRRVSIKKMRRSVRRLQDSFNAKISVKFRNHLSESRSSSCDQIETVF
ncbi:DUOXA2 [Lepeophtheirus salmonis]|uniref:DUOXA2 n=1 Tax=Lepeophtheirus salmonis TaxID=72036 RepID=A0A7R8CHZ7_LEPSM|nr:DUOXA2 [Lepeophtheirus salmonis]CAF2796008.1 DUOXA2 [Lepeophtheirus salmonis]